MRLIAGTLRATDRLVPPRERFDMRPIFVGSGSWDVAMLVG